MQIIILKKDNLRKYFFPDYAKESYYIKDFDEYGNEEDLLSIEIVNKAWNFVSNDKCQVIENNSVVKFAPLFLNKLYVIKINNKNNFRYEFILVCNDDVKNFESYQLNGDGDYTIGSLSSSDIVKLFIPWNKRLDIFLADDCNGPPGPTILSLTTL